MEETDLIRRSNKNIKRDNPEPDGAIHEDEAAAKMEGIDVSFLANTPAMTNTPVSCRAMEN